MAKSASLGLEQKLVYFVHVCFWTLDSKPLKFAWLLNVWTTKSAETISILFSVGLRGSVFHPFTWKAHKRLKYSKGLVRSIIFQPRNVIFLHEVQSRLLTQFSHTMPRFQRNFFHKRPFFALLLPLNSLLLLP